jgi:hypothetical protein
MPKKAISITIAEENLVWLQGQARGGGRRSVSEIVDRLVSDARSAGRVHQDSIRSVVGTIRIAAPDTDLVTADAAIRALFPAPSARRRRA